MFWMVRFSMSFNQTSVSPFDLRGMCAGMDESLPEDKTEEECASAISLLSSASVGNGCSYSCNDFLELDGVSIPSISDTLAPFYCGTQRIHILHQNLPLKLQCACLKVRFGISKKFVDHAGRPRLNFVVDASPKLYNILDEADGLAQKLSTDSGSSSEWHHVVTRKPGYFNSPTVRLHLPTVADGEIMRWTTEIYQKDNSATQKLMFSRFELLSWNPCSLQGPLLMPISHWLPMNSSRMLRS